MQDISSVGGHREAVLMRVIVCARIHSVNGLFPFVSVARWVPSYDPRVHPAHNQHINRRFNLLSCPSTCQYVSESMYTTIFLHTSSRVSIFYGSGLPVVLHALSDGPRLVAQEHILRSTYVYDSCSAAGCLSAFPSYPVHVSPLIHALRPWSLGKGYG